MIKMTEQEVRNVLDFLNSKGNFWESGYISKQGENKYTLRNYRPNYEVLPNKDKHNTYIEFAAKTITVCGEMIKGHNGDSYDEEECQMIWEETLSEIGSDLKVRVGQELTKQRMKETELALKTSLDRDIMKIARGQQ